MTTPNTPDSLLAALESADADMLAACEAKAAYHLAKAARWRALAEFVRGNLPAEKPQPPTIPLRQAIALFLRRHGFESVLGISEATETAEVVVKDALDHEWFEHRLVIGRHGQGISCYQLSGEGRAAVEALR